MMRLTVPDILVQIIVSVQMWKQIEIRELRSWCGVWSLVFIIFTKATDIDCIYQMTLFDTYIWTSKALEATVDFFWFIRHRDFPHVQGKTRL